MSANNPHNHDTDSNIAAFPRTPEAHRKADGEDTNQQGSTTMSNSYEEKLEARRQRYLELAEAARRKQRRQERTENTHTLQVGDVLVSSWGYEQTNIDYFEVTKRVGQTMVEVREIAAMKEHTGDMQGKSVPAVGQYVGEPMRRRVSDGNAVKITSCSRAYPLEYQEIEGVRVYRAHHWTSYA